MLSVLIEIVTSVPWRGSGAPPSGARRDSWLKSRNSFILMPRRGPKPGQEPGDRALLAECRGQVLLLGSQVLVAPSQESDVNAPLEIEP